jgi:flavin-dependent dehydrogenase
VDRCDVLIAGGGPAGSACAWKLRQAGLDVIVLDRAVFPRDKVCAGWITPQVIAELRLDPEEYRHGRTFQPITGFRTGTIGGAADVETRYDRPVSFGIRRCEFDHYLLQRSGARLMLGVPIATIRRDGPDWIVNDAVRAPALIGAGGHFCPVARWLNGSIDSPDASSLVVAQEVEFAIDPSDAAVFRTASETPELYFCADMKGYGWCFRKQDYVNVGFGRLDRQSVPRATAEFVRFLEARRTVPRGRAWRWRGHAYLVQNGGRRRVIGRGVLLIGDAAGLAYPESGEGIRPAIESGLLAAATLVEANGCYAEHALASYDAQVRVRSRAAPISRMLSRLMPPGVWTPLARRLLEAPTFVRHVILDRWFLHRHQPQLPLS